MAGQIRMTPETMRERASAYRTEGDTLQGVIEKMDNLLEMLQSEWEGSAAQAYSDKFNDLRPGFLKARDLIEEIAKSLEATASAVEETDNNIANAYRA